MPEHVHYVEPYFGGGSVLLQKPYEGVSEVANDIDGELTNFWRVLQIDEFFGEFLRLVEATPFSQEEFRAAIKWSEVGGGTEVSKAWRFFIRARQSRQALMKDFATLSRNRTRRGMNEQASAWLNAIEGLPDIHERLKRVVILNDDAPNVIRQQDGPKTHFYCDPPYIHETRVTTSDYAHEMSPSEHATLLQTLAGIEGTFQLSGYRSKLYDEVAGAKGWHRVDIDIDNKASSKKTKTVKTECIWMNYYIGDKKRAWLKHRSKSKSRRRLVRK